MLALMSRGHMLTAMATAYVSATVVSVAPDAAANSAAAKVTNTERVNTVAADKRTALHVEILPEDLAWAEKQNRHACAIVRAVQRTLPDALRVTADKFTIEFSLPADDTRYTFETPRNVVNKVIRPFDEGRAPQVTSFNLTTAIAAKPIDHRNREQAIRDRTGTRKRRHAAARRDPSKNPQVHTYGRFFDAEAEAGDQ